MQRALRSCFEPLEARVLLSTDLVTSTSDSGSLWQSMLGADSHAGADGIDVNVGPRLEESEVWLGSSPKETFECSLSSGRTNSVALRVSGVDLVLADKQTGSTLFRRPLASVSELIIHGVDGFDDTLTVDFGGGVPQTAVTFHGGAAGYDTLVVSGVTTGSYAPGNVFGDGVIQAGASTISFTGLEPVEIDGAESGTNDFTFTTSGSADKIEIDILDNEQNQISGTSDGVAFESIKFKNIQNFTIDTGTNDTAGADADTITISHGLVAAGLQNLTINAGSGDDVLQVETTSLALPLVGGALTFNGGGGNDEIRGPSDLAGVNWAITGADAGNLNGDLTFSGVESLVGAADSDDKFRFMAGGTLSGRIEGGAGGFDSLVIDGGDFNAVTFTELGPDSGIVALDDTAITYSGLEPITYSGTAANMIFNLTGGADQFKLITAESGLMTLDSQNGTFEDTDFAVPSGSLTINMGGGNDVFTIESLDSTFHGSLIVDGGGGGYDSVTFGATTATSFSLGALSITAESITIASGAAINAGSGDVTLTAVAEADGVSDTSATVTVNGQITTTGALRITAKTQGTVASTNPGGTVANTFTDSATVAVTGSGQISAGTIELKAQRLTSYSATGRNAYNNISGDVKAYIDGKNVQAGAGGLTLSALDSVELIATSPEMEVDMGVLSGVMSISVAAARNSLSGNTEAYIKNSTVTATGGDVEVKAEREAKVGATAAATSLTGTLPTAVSLTLGGTYTSNVVRGDVKAYAESSTLTTTGGGAVRVEARDRSAIDATSELSAIAETDPNIGDLGGSAGLSVAFNTIGWDPNPTSLPDLTVPLQITNALLGINFGTEDTLDVEAYLLNTNVTAAGDVSVLADSAPQINATVSNAAETTASGLYGAIGGAASGILTGNMVSSAARAWISYSLLPDNTLDVSAGGSVTVAAEDNAGIYANTKVVSTSITTNDGGANVLNDAISILMHDHESGDGSTALSYGDKVLLSNDYGNGGTPGRVYEFLGADETTPRNLSNED